VLIWFNVCQDPSKNIFVYHLWGKLRCIAGLQCAMWGRDNALRFQLRHTANAEKAREIEIPATTKVPRCIKDTDNVNEALKLTLSIVRTSCINNLERAIVKIQYFVCNTRRIQCYTTCLHINPGPRSSSPESRDYATKTYLTVFHICMNRVNLYFVRGVHNRKIVCWNAIVKQLPFHCYAMNVWKTLRLNCAPCSIFLPENSYPLPMRTRRRVAPFKKERAVVQV
jgi:hypothetical protein